MQTTFDVFVCPACAGMIRAYRGNSQAPRSLPRMRGDDPTANSCSAWSAPVCPACAGMIRRGTRRPPPAGCLPRMRGDDPRRSEAAIVKFTFAPHARG